MSSTNNNNPKTASAGVVAPPNKKVVCNPYAKKRKAPPPPPPSKQSFSYAPSRNKNTNNNSSSYMDNNSNSNTNSNDNGSDNVFGTDTVSFIAGSFSQAFNSIDDTPNFRRASDSFQELKKKDSSKPSLSKKAKKAKKNNNKNQKNSNNYDNNTATSTATTTASASASSSSSRHGDGGGNRDGGGGALTNTAASTSSTRIAAPNASASANANTTTDIRIHHTMLQPHVLYVSPKQRGNTVLSLIKNVPIAYSTMIPDYIMGPTTCGLFLSIKYHKLHPRYIHKRISELNKDFKLRLLFVLVDIDDNTNSIQQLNLIGVRQNFTVLLCWSEIELARYLETYKSKDGKTHDISCITKKESTNIVDRVTDFLISGHKGIGGVNKTDSITLWNTFGSIKSIATASPDELSLCIGMGPLKVKRLYNAFHKPFSKFQSRKRKRKKLLAEKVETEKEEALLAQAEEEVEAETEREEALFAKAETEIEAETEKEEALLAKAETEIDAETEKKDDDDKATTITSKNEYHEKEVV